MIKYIQQDGCLSRETYLDISLSRPQKKNVSSVINPSKAEQAHVALRNTDRKELEMCSLKSQPAKRIVGDTFIEVCSLVCTSAF